MTQATCPESPCNKGRVLPVVRLSWSSVQRPKGRQPAVERPLSISLLMHGEQHRDIRGLLASSRASRPARAKRGESIASRRGSMVVRYPHHTHFVAMRKKGAFSGSLCLAMRACEPAYLPVSLSFINQSATCSDGTSHRFPAPIDLGSNLATL